MTRHTRLLALATLATSSFAFAADPENLGARPSSPPPRVNFDQDGPPISRSDSLLRRGDVRILDPGPSLIDPPPRSREAWQQAVERDVDRAMGRIESDEVFQLRQIDRDDARRFDVFDRPREFERFEEERDRTLRLEEQARDSARAVERARQFERESDRLAADRARFQRAMNANTSPAAVTADTRMLQQLKTGLDADLARLATDHASALRAIDANPNLTPDQRTSERAAAEQRFTESRAQRVTEYQQRRATILGDVKTK